MFSTKSGPWNRGRKMVRLQTRIFSHRACVSILLLFFLFFLFFVLFGPALAGQDKAPTEAAAANSVVAIGDVHGDFDDFVTILQKAGLIDEQHHWTGGKTTFVQVGDLLDRGPKPRDVMDLMMSLEKEAPKAGGRVVGLLGNHEIMNIMGEIKAFDAAKQYLQNEKVILPFFTLQEMTAVVQAELSAERKSLMPGNQQRQAKMMEFLGFQDWLSVRPDGPLWFRGYDQWSEEEGVAQVSKLLEAYKATHIAVGHTVQKGGRIRPRFGNKVFLIDTGMLSSYYPGGRASALEIRNDAKFTAEYMDQQVVLLEPAAVSLREGVPDPPASVEDAVRISKGLPLQMSPSRTVLH